MAFFFQKASFLDLTPEFQKHKPISDSEQERVNMAFKRKNKAKLTTFAIMGQREVASRKWNKWDAANDGQYRRVA